MKKILPSLKFNNKIGSDAFFDWIIILLVSCLIVLFLIGIGSYIYVNTETELASHAEASVVNTKPSFDLQMLKKVIGTFDARANERVLLSKGYNGPADPSLP